MNTEGKNVRVAFNDGCLNRSLKTTKEKRQSEQKRQRERETELEGQLSLT